MTAPDSAEMTPAQLGERLREASKEGNLDIVNQLLADGADMDAVDVHAQTPLFLASWKGHTEIVDRLLAAGANKEAQNVDEQTPLNVAASFGNSEVVKRLLIAGANREAKDNTGQTSLFNAVIGQHKEVIKHLLGAGAAHMSARSKNGSILMHHIPNDEIRNIFNLYNGSSPYNDSNYEVGQTMLVPAKRIVLDHPNYYQLEEIQKVEAKIIEFSPCRYDLYNIVLAFRNNSITNSLSHLSNNLAELIHFVFPQLFPDKEPIGDLPDTNPYKTNDRLQHLLRLLNKPDDSLDERNKIIEEIYNMNDASINVLFNRGREEKKIKKALLGIKVEFVYSPGVFAYYKSAKNCSKIPKFFPENYIPLMINTGIKSDLPKYNLEQSMAITDWMDNNSLPFYFGHFGTDVLDSFKSFLTNPLVGNERICKDIVNNFENEYDLLYQITSPTPTKRILYRGDKSGGWPEPNTSVRTRTIFATSTDSGIAASFGINGNYRKITIPAGTRILDLSNDFNPKEKEVLVFPSVRGANMVIEHLPRRNEWNEGSVIIRNVNEERNRNLRRSRRRSRRNNNQRRSTRKR